MTSPCAVTDAVGYPLELQCEARLSDGRVAAIRPIGPEDANALHDFHEHLSSETVYRRFFATHPHLQAKEVERYTHVDYRNRLALVAEIDGQLSAVARYDREPDRARAEVAFVVADALQGHGVGAMLLEHLAAAARRRGVATFVAQTLGSNYAMQHVFRYAGFNCVERWVDGVIEVSFPIAPTQRYLEALIQRDVLSVGARLGAIPRAPGGGLGLVLGTQVDAEAVLAACQSAGLDVSTALVTEELGIEATDALLYLGWDSDCDVVGVQSAGLLRPRRFVAIAREAARARPVVSVVAAGPAKAWAEQAGVAGVLGTADLIDRGGELLAARRGGNWRPPQRGEIVELPDCDLAGARAALDEASASAQEVGTAPRRLASGPAREVLAAYGIPRGPSPAMAADGCGHLALDNQPRIGLVATAGSPRTGLNGALARLLPLTDRDAAELVEAAGVAGARTDAAVDVLLRAARLIDDQPDVARIEITHPGPTGGEARPAVAVWTARDRSTDDDPFVRRLPSSAPA